VFDGADDDPSAGLASGLRRLLDGIGVEITAANTDSRSGYS
jgi:hypothetical protein